MSRLSHHLDQIGLCCSGIDTLPFPPPKIFTNALLSNHDITSLIRDTESHERALFSVPPPPPANQTSTPNPSSGSGSGSAHKHTSSNAEEQSAPKRRKTVFNVSSGSVTTGPPTSRSTNPRRHTAVSAVLGPAMTAKLQRTQGSAEVDVDVLLKGAEKLCGVYEQPGARERIGHLRGKYRAGRSTMAYYEGKVAEQAEALAEYNKDWMESEEEEEEDGEVWTVEDLRREEEEAREMERKKRELQGRLKAMNQDLGGLMDMS